MKGILFGILFLIILIIGGFFIFKNLKTNTPNSTSNKSPEVSLVGVLQSVPPTPQYSYIITVNSQTIGVNSTKVNLAPFSGKKVQIIGQYSGTTMYADQISEVR